MSGSNPDRTPWAGLLYRPNADYWGVDSFQFQVDDGKLGTDTAVVSINVQPVNDVPLAPGQSVGLTEDSPAGIVLPASDKETPRAGLSFNLVTGPAHGSLTPGANGIWLYTPTTDFFGSDSFAYTVTDRGRNDADPISALTSAAGTIQLTVNPANDAPTLNAVANQSLNEGELLSLSLSGHDPEGQALAYSLLSGPLGAGVNAATGLFTWTATDGEATYDVTVAVGDGAASASRSFQIVVHNVAPTLSVKGQVAVGLGEVYSLSLGTSDPGADTLSQWEINWGDGNVESLAGNAVNASHAYMLDGDYSILIGASDEDGSYAANPVAVTVISPNHEPVAQGQYTQTSEDQAFVISLGATDQDGDSLTFSLLTSPVHGVLGALDPLTHQVVFTPNANFVGQDSFVFQVTDGQGGSATATINVKVLPVNDAPTAHAQSVSVNEDGALPIQLTGADLETAATALLFNLVGGPAHGTLAQNPGGAWQYIPDADFSGADSFQFSVTDGGQYFTCGCGIDYSSAALTSAPVTVSILVSPMNDAPDLGPVGDHTLLAGQALSLDLPVIDPDDGDTLTFGLLSGPAGASVNADSGSFQWTAPYLDTIAIYPVTVSVSDGHGGTDQASFNLTIDPDLLEVVGFEATTTGYHVRFNHAVDASRLNLYDGQNANWGLTDAVLKDCSNKAVAGSIVVDADQMGYTFVKTGNPKTNGLLTTGGYSLTLDSRSNAFTDEHGRLLDGNNDGVAGGNYSGGFTIASSSSAILSLGEFARGPGQDINLPASGSGLPIKISNAAGVSKISFTLKYDASLLDITNVTGLVGSNTQVTTSPGQISVEITGIAGLTNALTDVVKLTAKVPAATITSQYGAKHILDLGNLHAWIGSTEVSLRDDDGLHVVAFLGDTTGNAAYTTYDVTLLQRVLVRLDTGFGAYPLADPMIVGNVTANGTLSALDTRLLTQKVQGLTQTAIPAIPAGIDPITYSGADPLVSLPTVDAKAGETVTVPVNLDTAAGLASVQLKLAYSATDLQLVAVRQGSLTLDFGWVVTDNKPGLLTVDMSRLNALTGGTGSLLELDFRVAPTAVGTLALDLQWAQLNETRLTLNPAPQVGKDATDGAIRVKAAPKLRFDQTASAYANERSASQHADWLGQWVGGQTEKSARKPAWRLVLPRG